jgi:hypothetical protein
VAVGYASRGSLVDESLEDTGSAVALSPWMRQPLLEERQRDESSTQRVVQTSFDHFDRLDGGQVEQGAGGSGDWDAVDRGYVFRRDRDLRAMDDDPLVRRAVPMLRHGHFDP